MTSRVNRFAAALLLSGVIAWLWGFQSPACGQSEGSPNGDMERPGYVIPTNGAARDIRVGVMAEMGSENTLNRWKPLEKYLNNALTPHRFRVIPIPYDELDSFVTHARVDFLLADPHLASMLAQHRGAQLWATFRTRYEGQPSDYLGSVIFCNANRNDLKTRRNAAELRYQTFAAVSPKSFGGFLAGYWELREAGLDIKELGKDRLIFTQSAPEVVAQVLKEEADIGIAPTGALEQMAKNGQLSLQKIHIMRFSDAPNPLPCLLSTAIYPQWGLVSLKHAPPHLAQQVTQKLLAMPADDECAVNTNIAGFNQPLDYQSAVKVSQASGFSPENMEMQWASSLSGLIENEYLPWAVAGLIALVLLILLSLVLIFQQTRLRKARNVLDEELKDRTEAQTALKNSEIRYRTLVDNMSMGVIMVDTDYTIIAANQAYAALCDCDLEKVIGKKCHDVFRCQDTACQACPGAMSLAKGRPYKGIMEYPQKNGELRIFDLQSSAVLNNKNKVAGFIQIITDITRKRNMEKTLEISEARYRSLFSELNEGFVLCDLVTQKDGTVTNLRILEANPSFETMLHRDPNSSAGKMFSDVAAFFKADWIHLLANIAIQGQPMHFDEVAGENGRWYKLLAFSPEKGQVAALFEDITEQREADAKLREMQSNEMMLSSNIQQTLLTSDVPESLDGLQLAVLESPSSKIDGDFHEFILHDPRHLDLLAGDVMGKGASAALLGAATKLEFLRAICAIAKGGDIPLPTPEDIVMGVHRNLTPKMIQHDVFSSFCMARFNLDANRLDFINGGYAGILIYRAQSGQCESMGNQFMPLGFSNKEEYRQESVSLNPDDLVLFFSDGVLNLTNAQGENFSKRRLEELLENCGALAVEDFIEELRQRLVQFAENDFLDVDMTCIAAKCVNSAQAAPLRQDRLEFQSNINELSTMRHFVRTACKSNPKLDEFFISRFELAINEIACNIIRHAYQERGVHSIMIDVSIYDDRTTARLSHHGAPLNVLPVETPNLEEMDSGDLSLFLIRQCIDHVVYGRHENGAQWIQVTKQLEIK